MDLRQFQSSLLVRSYQLSPLHHRLSQKHVDLCPPSTVELISLSRICLDASLSSSISDKPIRRERKSLAATPHGHPYSWLQAINLNSKCRRALRVKQQRPTSTTHRKSLFLTALFLFPNQF